MFKYQVTSNGPPPVYAPVTSGWYLFDGLGSTRAVVDDSGVGQSEFGYGDAFGIPYQVAANGTRASAGAGFFLNGQQWDGSGIWNSGEGLYFNRARYYQSGLGRFIGEDSYPETDRMPETLNRYLYCISDPLNNVDPSGYVHFIFTGGVREKTDKDGHDKTPDNFIRQARRFAESLTTLGEDVELAFYTPSYRKRAERDGKNSEVYIKETLEHARNNGYIVKGFTSTDKIIRILNSHSDSEIEGFYYFGHSESKGFLLNYGQLNTSGGEADRIYFGQDEVKRVRSAIFSNNAVAKLFGCNLGNTSGGTEPLGQTIAKLWKMKVIAPTVRTVYTPNGIIPFLTNEGFGQWVSFAQGSGAVGGAEQLSPAFPNMIQRYFIRAGELGFGFTYF